MVTLKIQAKIFIASMCIYVSDLQQDKYTSDVEACMMSHLLFKIR
jgi:hypothetical protein